MDGFDRLDGFPRRGRRAAASAIAAAAVALLTAAPADATFHIAHIHRVMAGLDGNTDVQYVEIEMDQTGQQVINSSKLIAFNADGSFAHVVFTVSGSTVASGKDRPWIMASAAFAAASGITPDFVFDSTNGKGLMPEDGMVCWGKPSDQTNPDSPNMVDCVSYGNYTGPANVHTSAPSAITPFGHGLVRIAFTGSSAGDFACEDPAMPRNNAFQTGEIFASAPCGGAECGNGAVEDAETCDDGDTDFTPGDSCSADCEAFPCGIPTNVAGTSPKTGDALFVLKAAVQASNCDVLVCDVNGSNTVNTSDALLILKRAVGQDIPFNCPL